jgi:carbonic anhydrase/acetyltransferase-like protein (isoleucine patch superfamily)
VALYRLEGHAPALDDECWVAPDAVLIGKVKVEPGASIWFGAVLRGDNEMILVGSRTNIQDLSVLHTDPGFPLTIGQDCTVGHRAILHGCTIGENTLVGMGAIVLNGAVVGRNCLIGAGALIAEGKTIPDNSLVLGMPGKVARTLDKAAEQMLSLAADAYARRWPRYRDGLKLL